MKGDGDKEKLGNAFNENHKLLFPVSTRSIEEVRKIALDNGALGAKLTGAGGEGGAVIIIIEEESKNNLIKRLEEKGYKSFSVEIAKTGAKVEMNV